MKERIAAAFVLSAAGALAVWAMVSSGAEREIASYTTSLNGRTPSQVHNVATALRSVNGKVLMPGETFSFLKSVGPWTADRGYRKAPVSYDGELVRSYGGGVCQLSSTLYNTALLAGLEIVERHSHHWPARYAPIGRDAAVAHEEVDLRFRNSLPVPVRLSCSIEGEKLKCAVRAACRPGCRVEVKTELVSVTRPAEVFQDQARGPVRWKLTVRGHPGYHVVTYRKFFANGRTRREFISEDTYQPMNRLVRLLD